MTSSLAAEVVSPSSRSDDRFRKPALYAQAGIPCYLRVELDPPHVVAYRIGADGLYEEAGRAESRGGAHAHRAVPDHDRPRRARPLTRVYKRDDQPISRTFSQLAANPGCSGRSWIRSTCTQSTASDSAVSCGAWKASPARPTTVT